jgi:hypothetical protein
LINGVENELIGVNPIFFESTFTHHSVAEAPPDQPFPNYCVQLKSNNMNAGNYPPRKCSALPPGNAAALIRGKGIIAALLAAIASQIPVGYQDETGFHIGVKMLPELSNPRLEKYFECQINLSLADDRGQQGQAF